MPEPATAEFLLEIGFEEMPAPWLPGLREQLAQRFREAAEHRSANSPVSPRAAAPARPGNAAMAMGTARTAQGSSSRVKASQ